MQKKWLGLIGGLVGILVVSAVVIPVTIHFLRKPAPEEDFVIKIFNDTDFGNYNLPGTGTKNDPYIIANYSIDTTSSSAIYIRDTTKYFVIKNCTLKSTEYGIYIWGIARGTVSISNCKGNGIKLQSAYESLIENNNFSQHGILVDYSPDSVINNNICYNSSNYGILVLNSANTTLTNNYCYSSYYDEISIVDSINVSLIDNFCDGDLGTSSTGSGISLQLISNVLVQNNTCINCHDSGIELEDSFSATIIDNNCSWNVDYGIHLLTSSYCSIINNICYDNGQMGIYLRLTNDLSVINNNCSFNGFYGIRSQYSGYTTVINNTCYFNLQGIHLDSTIASIINNTCSKGTFGILSNTQNVTVSHNKCINNTNGMYIGSDEARIFNNTFSDNSNYGLYLSSTTYPLITASNNQFYNCGLQLSGLMTLPFYLGLTLENNSINGKQLGYFTNLTNVDLTVPLYGQLILVNCSGIEIANQNINDTSNAVNLFYCTNISISDSIFHNNVETISIITGNNITINNNTCTSNDRGLAISFSINILVLNNTLKNNIVGIRFYDTDNSTITNNTINFNHRGIILEATRNNTVIYNTFMNNTNYALDEYSDSSTCFVHHNDFINNYYGGTSQAKDLGIPCIWYDILTNEGNYWSDWTGVGEYYIDGNAAASDPFPLSSPVG